MKVSKPFYSIAIVIKIINWMILQGYHDIPDFMIEIISVNISFKRVTTDYLLLIQIANEFLIQLLTSSRKAKSLQFIFITFNLLFLLIIIIFKNKTES